MAAAPDSSEREYVPGAREWRSADIVVLILVLIALVGGLVLRQSSLYATQSAKYEGLSFDVPSGAIVQSAQNEYAVRARNGLTIRAEKLPAPAFGADDGATLAAARAVQLAQKRTLFQTTETAQAQAAGKDAGLIRYQYVESSNQFFANGLRIMVGNELLIPNGDNFYALSLEGPADKREEVNALWPKIQSSVRLGG